MYRAMIEQCRCALRRWGEAAHRQPTGCSTVFCAKCETVLPNNTRRWKTHMALRLCNWNSSLGIVPTSLLSLRKSSFNLRICPNCDGIVPPRPLFPTISIEESAVRRLSSVGNVPSKPHELIAKRVKPGTRETMSDCKLKRKSRFVNNSLHL